MNYSMNLKNFQTKTFTLLVGNNENNPSNIEVSTDPGRSLMERVTNAIDSVLELQYLKETEKTTLYLHMMLLSLG